MATVSECPLSLVKFGQNTILPTMLLSEHCCLALYICFLRVFLRHFGTFTWSTLINKLCLLLIRSNFLLLMKLFQTLVLGVVDSDKNWSLNKLLSVISGHAQYFPCTPFFLFVLEHSGRNSLKSFVF